MQHNKNLPDFVFETSWEVCNKVGGIYTVLSSRAKTLKTQLSDNLVFIGPDLGEAHDVDFTEDKRLKSRWQKACAEAGLGVRVGRWNVPGEPVAVLVDFKPFFEQKDEIYAQAWQNFGVDSLHAYGDYDEASMFSYAAGKFVEILINKGLVKGRVVYQAHEWMSGLGMLFLKKNCPSVHTIFTTHATSIGRSICGNDKQLYAYFEGYNGDQMARELNMEAKHSIEKISAQKADCFTTVSDFTARECEQLLDKNPDVVLPNGFEPDFVPTGANFTNVRRKARQKIRQVVGDLTGCEIDDDVLIISTSGRNDFRCKGFDVYIEAMSLLNNRFRAQGVKGTKVISLIEVPCWLFGPRKDLQERQESKKKYDFPLDFPQISHDLYNLNEDRILSLVRAKGLNNEPESAVKVVLVPCYLDGNDGVFNLPYYDMLAANDMAIYPSYYEPWGYTPLEACAFHTPTVTTNLSGFGQWVNSVLGRDGQLTDGVLVIPRDDSNYFSVCHQVADAVIEMMNSDRKQRANMRKNAAKMAEKAEWKYFVEKYYEAYALNNK